MNTSIQLVALVIFTALASSCQGQQSIDTFLQKEHKKGTLNGNVLVLKDGKTLYENAFGVANGAKTIPLTGNHKFQIGSIYKEFPAVAIMQLEEKGLLEVNDPVSKHLPDYPAWAQEVTITHLLQYSSGLPQINWNAYFSNELNPKDQDLVKEIKGVQTLEFTPGTDYLYTNASPILLIQIVEKIAGMPFDAYLQENVFERYQLENIVIKNQYPYADDTLMALPFNTDYEEDNFEISVRSVLFSATTHALAKWMELVGDYKIISKESVKFLSEEVKEGGNIQSPLGRYDWENGKSMEHSHHGSSANYEGIVRRFKQEGITIVILTNQKHRNVYDLSDEILDIVRGMTPE